MAVLSSEFAAPLPLQHLPDRPSCLLAGVGVEGGGLTCRLDEALTTLCHEAAALLATEVVTVYGLERGEDEDELLVLGNVGFPLEVIGNLRLRRGDGIVGWVAECMRPIALASAADDPRFLTVRGIGEEQLPAMLATPILRRGELLGVLVLQRAEARAFADLEVRVAALLAESAGLILEAAERGAPARAREDVSALSLAGVPATSGFALGRVDLLPTAEAMARRNTPAPSARDVGEALVRLERDVTRMRVDHGHDLDVARALTRLDLVLADARLRERLLAAAGERDGLATLTRAYGRAPFMVVGPAPDPGALAHASDVEELCVLLHLGATGGFLRQSGRIWMGERLGGFFALAASRSAAAVVLDGDGTVTVEAAAIARAASLPVVTGVRGLFAWTRPGDLLLVEADVEGGRGIVRVNPASVNLAAARTRRATR